MTTDETPLGHSIRSAGEHYPVFKKKPLTEVEYLEAQERIRMRGAGFFRVCTEKDNKQAVYRCFIRGEFLYCTWCRERQCITTFLPPDKFVPKGRKAAYDH